MMEATCDDCGIEFEADTITPDNNGDVSCPDCLYGTIDHRHHAYR